MAKLDRLQEARALRDSALELFLAELDHVRDAARPSAIGERMVSRVGEKADAASDAALGFAERHQAAAIATAGAVAGTALWLARGPVMRGINRLLGRDEEDTGDNLGEEEAEEFDDE